MAKTKKNKSTRQPNKVKAYVLEDGSVVKEQYLNTFRMATKQDKDSNQLHPDVVFKTSEINQKGLVDPLHSIDTLVQVFEINTYHYRCVRAKVADSVRVGWKIVPIKEVENYDEAQKERAEAFFKSFNDELPFVDVMDRIGVDYWSTGNGALELFTNGQGEELVTGGAHLPIHTTRLHKSMTKLAQKRANKIVWFKIAGADERDLNKETGNFEENVPPEKKANEVIFFKNFTSRSDYYGIPDILPAIGAVLGDRQRQEFNLDFFENHAVPAYAVTVTGADLDPEVEQQIKDFFQNKLKKNRHSTLVLTAQKDPEDMSSEPIKFHFEALSVDVKEASFRLYRRDNRDEILSAHGVPPYRAGIVESGSLGQNVAKETTEIYKNSTIGPAQSMFQYAINKHILERLGITDWRFEFQEIDTTDEKHDLDMVTSKVDKGLMTPNQAREALGMEPVDNPEMDQYYYNGRSLTGIEEQNAQLRKSLTDATLELQKVKKSIVKTFYKNHNES